jgi:hypothetical protein
MVGLPWDLERIVMRKVWTVVLAAVAALASSNVSALAIDVKLLNEASAGRDFAPGVKTVGQLEMAPLATAMAAKDFGSAVTESYLEALPGFDSSAGAASAPVPARYNAERTYDVGALIPDARMFDVSRSSLLEAAASSPAERLDLLMTPVGR